MDLVAKKKLIAHFLHHANAYAATEIARYASEAKACGDPMQRLALAEKEHRWQVYSAFNSFTVDELLSTEKLDLWLED